MKARLSLVGFLGLVLAASLPAAVLAQDKASPSPARARAETLTANSPQAATNLPVAAVGGRVDAVSPLIPTPPKAPPSLSSAYQSPWFTEVAKLARAGIEDRVLLSYIDSAGTFNLDPDQIIYLRNAGVSARVLGAMMQHDLDFAAGLLPAAAPTAPLPPSTFHLALVSTPDLTVQPPTLPAPAAPPVSSGALENFSGPGLGEFPEPNFAGNDANALDRLPVPGQLTHIPATTFYPVREPYPVKLLDPIIFIPGEERPANLLLVRMP